MKVIIKEPGKVGYEKDIPNSLESLQAEVGGLIEAVTFNPRLVAIVNEEGRLMEMPMNIAGLVGPIVFCGVDGDDLGDIDEKSADLLLLGYSPVRQNRAQGVEVYVC